MSPLDPRPALRRELRALRYDDATAARVLREFDRTGDLWDCRLIPEADARYLQLVAETFRPLAWEPEPQPVVVRRPRGRPRKQPV